MRKDKQNQGYQAKEEKLGGRRDKEGQILEVCFQEKGTNLFLMTGRIQKDIKGLEYSTQDSGDILGDIL